MATSKAVKLSLPAKQPLNMSFFDLDNRAFSFPAYSIGCLLVDGNSRLFFTLNKAS